MTAAVSEAAAQQDPRQLTVQTARHAAPGDDLRRSASYAPQYGAPPPPLGAGPQYGAPPPGYGPSPSFKQSPPGGMPGTVPGVPMAPVNEVRRDDCECTCGWTLFGLGFLFPILWAFGMCRGCESDDPNEKRAAKACTIAFLIYIPIWVVILVLRVQSGNGRYAG
jgi:hypothetical protein